MSELFPKFVIEDGNLILSKVSLHKNLVKDKDKVKGGGWFKYDGQTETFVLYGESFDFGKAKLEDIKDCIKNHKVFTNQYLTHDISDRKFKYDTGSEIIDL